MQIVINIDNELYEYFSKRRTMHDDGYFSHIGKLIKAFRDGTILPKGHGRLIDISEYEKYFNTEITYDDGNHIHSVYANTISTIIEADKERSDKE